MAKNDGDAPIGGINRLSSSFVLTEKGRGVWGLGQQRNGTPMPGPHEFTADEEQRMRQGAATARERGD